MTPSKIIQSLCDLVDDKRVVENEEYKRQDEEFGKWSDILERYMKDDKKFQKIFFNYSIAEGCLSSTESDIYFREGFLCGARLALEICGFERAEK